MENLTQFGSYQIIRKIGAGGMADVYEAVRVGLEDFQTRVALKCILPAMTRDERFVKMFINEARLGSQLQHPNIIQIQDFNKVNETYYIAMEYVDGVDLSRIIKRLAARGLSFPATVVIDLAIQALAGLGYAHEARRMDGSPMNIIHRDVKPSNFLITPGGMVKVGDFGIAKAANSASSNSMTGDQLKGTINYMSPEQIDGVPLTPSSDLFSVGAIIFEMLTLRPLFEGPTMSATLIKIAMVNIESDMNLVANRYPEFETLLRKALGRDPKDRYPIASVMAAELHKLRQEMGDGLSLREWLAMHKELFEPYGTQPGEQEEDDGPLSMAATPPYGSDRPDIFRTNPNLRDEALHTSFEIEGDDDGFPDVHRERLDPVVVDDDPSMGGRVNFEYYPPPPSGVDSAFTPPGSSPSGGSVWSGEDLSSAAQRLLQEEDEDAPVAPQRPALIVPTAAPEAFIEPPPKPSRRSRAGLFALVALIAAIVGAVGIYAFTTPPPAPPVVAATEVKPPEPADVPSAELSQPLPQPLPAVTAQLMLSSVPAGAHIIIDGRRLDALTPTTLPLPPDQTKVTVQLELEGYAPFTQELSYRPGQQLPLEPSLIPKATTGTINVQSTPAGARVFIDQKPTGKQTPASITGLELKGSHRVALRMPGYQPWIEEFEFGADGVKNVNGILERAPEPVASRPPPRAEAPPPRNEPPPSTGGIATLFLNTVPPDAEVYVDHQKRGEVPIALPVTAGSHHVEFRSTDGRKRKDISVRVSDGERRRLLWDFEEEKWRSQ
jgi:serine/threonine protein kinase